MNNPIIDYTLIGERIKNRRKELKLTQEELATNLNLSTFYLSKIENGHASATLDTLAIIANYLDLDLSFVITGTNKLNRAYNLSKLEQICAKANDRQLELIIRISKAILDE